MLPCFFPKNHSYTQINTVFWRIHHYIHFHLKAHSFKSIQVNFYEKILNNKIDTNIYVKKRDFSILFFIFHCFSIIKKIILILVKILFLDSLSMYQNLFVPENVDVNVIKSN